MIFFVSLSYFIFEFVNLIFEIISCRFEPWFPKKKIPSIEWKFLKDFYYFLGFLDYASICLPEIVVECVELKDLDYEFYNAVSFFCCVYANIVENFFEVIPNLFLSSKCAESLSIVELLHIIGIDSFESFSYCGYYTDVILFNDNSNYLDKYFLNISTEGWFRDVWEIKGPQVEYLKALAFKVSLLHDPMSAQAYQNELNFFFSKNSKVDEKNLTHLYMSLLNLQQVDNDVSKLTFKDYDDSYSLFYKLVMVTDRFFFDSFYLYFYLQDLNVMFRVNRLALVEIFNNNIIWGLVDSNRYPFNSFWDYNYYGIADSFFNDKNKSLITSIKNNLKVIMPYYNIINQNDIFLYDKRWINLAIFEDIDDKIISNDGIFEWIGGISEFKPEVWGDYIDNEFWKQTLDFRAQEGTEYSLEPITYDNNLIEEDFLEMKKRHVRLVKAYFNKKKSRMRKKYLKDKSLVDIIFGEEYAVEDDPSLIVFIPVGEKK
jgi:hypothetical protein